jgi:heavy metal sensor kinase
VAVVSDLGKELKETLGEYALTAPDGHLIQLRDSRSGDVILPVRSESAPLVPWQPLPAGLSTIQAAQGAYRVLRRDLAMLEGTYRLQMSSSLAAVSATRSGLVRWVGWVLPLTILLILGGGYLISRAALRPLEDFAGVANRVTAHRMSERLEAPGTGDVIDRLARTFNSMLERLEASVTRLDEFTADASHELRGPVAVIRTTAELALRQHRGEEDLKRDIAEIQTEAVRLSDLIEDLLTLARSDGNLHAPPLSAVDLSPIAAEVATQFCRLAGPRVSTDTGNRGWVVRGHAVSLRRLLLILIDNALRHNPDESKVVIGLTEEKGQVILSVADNGQGIAAAELPRLFDRFYRVDPSRNRSNGAGLGLSIARWIAQCHGGQITASSQMGQGSVFRVSLNAYPANGINGNSGEHGAAEDYGLRNPASARSAIS